MHDFLDSEYDLHDERVVSVLDDAPLWSAPFGLRLLQTVRLGRGLRALDVGSGTGFPIVELAQRLGPTCTAFGIDPWREAVRRLQQKIRTWEIGNLTVVEGVAESMPFATACFDLVVSNNGTNNVVDQEQTFREIFRVAKTGAQLLFTVNLPGTMHEFYEVFETTLTAHGMPDARQRIHDHIRSKRRPLAWTRSLVEAAGFEIVNVFEDSFPLRFTDASAMFRHSLVRLSFLRSWSAIVDGVDVERVFRALESALDSRAQMAGEITLTIPWACFDCRKLG